MYWTIYYGYKLVSLIQTINMTASTISLELPLDNSLTMGSIHILDHILGHLLDHLLDQLLAHK